MDRRFLRAQSIALGTFAAVVVLFWLGRESAPPDAPLPTATNRIDLGPIAPGNTVERTVLLRNQSSKSRRLQRVVPECSCLQAFTDAVVVVPGGEYELRVVLRVPTLVPVLEADKEYRVSVLFDEGDPTHVDVTFTAQVSPMVSPPTSTAICDPTTGAFTARSMLLLPSWLDGAEVLLAPPPGLHVQLASKTDQGMCLLSASGQINDLSRGATFQVEARVHGWDHPIAWIVIVPGLRNLRAVPNSLVLLPRARAAIALRAATTQGAVLRVEPEGACQAVLSPDAKTISVSEILAGIDAFNIEFECAEGRIRIPCYVVPHAP